LFTSTSLKSNSSLSRSSYLSRTASYASRKRRQRLERININDELLIDNGRVLTCRSYSKAFRYGNTQRCELLNHLSQRCSFAAGQEVNISALSVHAQRRHNNISNISSPSNLGQIIQINLIQRNTIRRLGCRDLLRCNRRQSSRRVHRWSESICMV
jgi:hypothetical protein